MKAAMDLVTLARDESTFQMMFVIERLFGGKLLEGLGFYSDKRLIADSGLAFNYIAKGLSPEVIGLGGEY